MSRSIAAVALLVASCSSPAEVPVQSPDGWDREIAVPIARDLSPDPNVVEVRIVAREAEVEILPGKKTKVWTYDGGIPGPTIRAKVGDQLVVHFENHLPEATTIHWHGLRVPASMDGNGETKIEPSAKFDYRFVLPDAGTFWYHPHVRSAAQVGYGLYGALIVEDPSEPRFGDEATIVLSDIGLLDDGTLGDSRLGGSIADLFGREGEPLLANGKVAPVIRARKGAPQRWRLVNAAKSRYYQLKLPGHRFHRIGGDGGLRETPLESDTLLLVPGERADVVVVPSADADLTWVPFDRGYGTTFARSEQKVLSLRLADLPAAKTPALPSALRTIAPLSREGARLRRVELTQSTVDGETVLGIDGKPFPKGEPLRAKVGDTEVWEVVNGTEWSHPFHLHGFFFQVVGSDHEWKDTLDIPKKSSRTIVVKYDDRPGMWMFHCHILDHADLGMMGMLMLESASTTGSKPTHGH